MNSKSILFFSFLMLGLVLSMGAACASENMDTPLEVDESQIEIENENVLSSVGDNNYEESETKGSEANLKSSKNDSSDPGLKASEDDYTLSANVGTFSELQNLIDNSNGRLVLDKDYIYDDGFNTEGIFITKSIEIDGNNSILDGNNLARIFNIQAPNVVLKNIKFINGYSSSRGGAIYWNGHSGSLINCIFNNNSANSSGGAVYWVGSRGTLTGSNFTGNNASVYGGAVYWAGSYGVLTGSIFINNSAGQGGAVFWGHTAINGVLTGSSFINNSAQGGAVYWRGADGTLSDSSFINNSAATSDCAGAVCWNADNGVLSGSSFINNFAPNSGGAVWWIGRDGVLSGSSFISNSAATYYGGAVYWVGRDGVLSGSNFTDNSVEGTYSKAGAVYWIANNGIIRYCNFTNNRQKYNKNFINSEYGGGAIQWQGYKGVITYCNFLNNSAGQGGAIYWYGVDGVLSGSNFTDNSAYVFGTVYWHGADGVLSGSNFINNIADRHAGVVYWFGTKGSLNDSNFINNSAGDSGGAVCWAGVDGVLSGSNFTDNSAYAGGAVYWYGADGNLSDSSFINNFATYNGGAVYWASVDGVLSGSNFTNNSASWSGGAVYWFGVDGVLTGSSFINNSALYQGVYDEDYDDEDYSTSGGAVCWLGADGVLSGSNFTDNYADMGGAVFWGGVNGVLSGSSFIYNSAKFGGAIYTRILNLSNSEFLFNSATKGSAIYKMYSSYNLVINNTVFGRNRADGDKIVIEVEGNETKDITVKITFYGNDNIANAIWNEGNPETVKLANITCEFSYDGIGREYKTFNKYDAPKAVESDHYVKGSDELWQSPLENAQLIDINITDSYGNVVYSIVNGTETRASGVERNLLRAFRPADNKPVNVTDVNGEISIKLSNLKTGSYKISAKHQDDDYYTMTANDDSFVVNGASSSVKADNVTVVYGEDIVVSVASVNATGVTYSVVDVNNVVVAGGVLKPGEAISGLDLAVGNYTVNLVTVVDDYHTSATGTSAITVIKAPSFVNATDVTVTYGESIVVDVTSVNATSVNYEVIDQNNVVVAGGVLKPGEAISGLDLAVGKYTVNLVTVVDGNHTSATGTSSITVENVLADLSVVKVLNKDTHGVGDIVYLTVTVTNHGPHHAENVVVFLNIHDELEFGSSSAPRPLTSGLLMAPNDHSYDHDTGFWTIGDLANGASTQLHLTLQTTTHGDYDLHSQVSASTFDHNMDNNAHKVSLSVLKGNESNNESGDDPINNESDDDPVNNETGDDPVNNETGGSENNNSTDDIIDDNVDNIGDGDNSESSDSSSVHKSSLDSNATGNPIAVLLVVLSLLLGVNIRRRK